MKTGDLVKNLHSESGMCGVVIDFYVRKASGGGYSVKMPVVLWADGRCKPIMPDFVGKVSESR